MDTTEYEQLSLDEASHAHKTMDIQRIFSKTDLLTMKGYSREYLISQMIAKSDST